MWFERLTGFKEKSPEQVRSNIEINGSKLVSKVNGAEFHFGRLTVPSLKELKDQSSLKDFENSSIKVSEIVANVQLLHEDPSNNGSLFQAASQFNLLEMVSPRITPESGVGIYENDFTQGPACAIACGAGTIYRNYFAEVDGRIGQSANNQIDCLKDIGRELGNDSYDLWKMSNGYALASLKGLEQISQNINNRTKQEYEELKEKLRIGIQWDTEVTLGDSENKVTQVYCSALPVAYSNIQSSYWETFARLILEATYESTFHATLLNYDRTGNDKVFLTLVGGGAFGNRTEWILAAIMKTIQIFKNAPLDVKIVSYGSSNKEVQKLLRSIELSE
jgi:hypothetical protein